MKVGFVAILGRPNSGKSTLVNALLSKKVSSVSPKAQTTRDSIFGILNEKDKQIVFVDTPGIFKGKSDLDRHLNKTAFDSSKGVEAIIYLLDGSKDDLEEDFKIIASLKEKSPIFLVLNKIDLLRAEEAMKKKEAIHERFPSFPLIEASFLTNFGLKEIKEAINPLLVEGLPYYPEGQITDKDLPFQAKETIRQKMLSFLSQEVPHQSAVAITSFKKEKGAYFIEAKIITEKDAHKAIVIGKGGAMIKKISMSSRHELERMWHEKVALLSIEVESHPGWRNDPKLLKDLGYGL